MACGSCRMQHHGGGHAATGSKREEGEFVLDDVSYQIVRIINEDVEYPLVYVVVLDILSQT